MSQNFNLNQTISSSYQIDISNPLLLKWIWNWRWKVLPMHWSSFRPDNVWKPILHASSHLQPYQSLFLFPEMTQLHQQSNRTETVEIEARAYGNTNLCTPRPTSARNCILYHAWKIFPIYYLGYKNYTVQLSVGSGQIQLFVWLQINILRINEDGNRSLVK